VRIFIDASAWVPMEVRADQRAPALARVMETLRSERNISFVTTNWTLYEALSVARRSDPRYAEMLHRRAGASAKVVQVDEVTEKRAVKTFLGWRDKKASVVDHANTAVAMNERCDALLSFDDDYFPLAAAAGLRILR
jgi:predicted nucleic acid-binding protein